MNQAPKFSRIRKEGRWTWTAPEALTKTTELTCSLDLPRSNSKKIQCKSTAFLSRKLKTDKLRTIYKTTEITQHRLRKRHSKQPSNLTWPTSTNEALNKFKILIPLLPPPNLPQTTLIVLHTPSSHTKRNNSLKTRIPWCSKTRCLRTSELLGIYLRPLNQSFHPLITWNNHFYSLSHALSSSKESLFNQSMTNKRKYNRRSLCNPLTRWTQLMMWANTKLITGATTRG